MPITKNPRQKTASESVADSFIKGGLQAAKPVQISLTFPPHLLSAIDNRAYELGISRASFIKQSCAKFLENE